MPDYVLRFLHYIFKVSSVTNEDSNPDYREDAACYANIRGTTLNVSIQSQDDFQGVYLYNFYSYPLDTVEKIVQLLD